MRLCAGSVFGNIASGDTELAQTFGGDGCRRGENVVELHVFGELACHAVDVQGIIGYAQALPWQAHGAFHEVRAAVDRAIDNIAEHILVGLDCVAAILAHECFVVAGRFLEIGGHGITCGEVEHHDVAFFNIAQAGKAAVRYGRRVEVALDAHKVVVHQGEMHGRHRNAGSVHKFIYPQIVARQEGFFKRAGGYLVILPHEREDEEHKDEGIHDGIYPAHDRTDGLVLAFFPPCEWNVAGNINVEQQESEQRQPPGTHPHAPGQKERKHDAETDPSCFLCGFYPLYKILCETLFCFGYVVFWHN